MIPIILPKLILHRAKKMMEKNIWTMINRSGRNKLQPFSHLKTQPIREVREDVRKDVEN
jgi:hypothetical protein